MNFYKFKETFQNQKAFSISDITKEWPNFNFVNLVNWQQKGYLLRLRNTWYAFPDNLNNEADLYFLANRLRSPSYVSLESALSYYNWIPESVFSITSVTTAKPAEYETPVGFFSYRSVKPQLFFGYQLLEGTDCNYYLAEPEKTLLDFLYLNPRFSKYDDFAALRFNQEEIKERLSLARMEDYLSIIDSRTLMERWNTLKNFLEL